MQSIQLLQLYVCCVYLQVSENGAISFEQEWRYFTPLRFPTSSEEIMQRLVVAPFWSDNDIRKEGAVRYATYTKGEGSALGETLLTNLTWYIRGLNREPDFVGHWLLIAHWDGVHPSPHGGSSSNGISQVELDKVRDILSLSLRLDTFYS